MEPLVFEPLLKRIRWGGRRLGTVLKKAIGPETDYAESWELADYGADQSIVAEGPCAGSALNDLVRAQSQCLLGVATPPARFPLLIKFLDANDWLSLQVHPNDEQARQIGPLERGKTEAWVILDAAPDSRICAGLLDGVTASDLRAAITANRTESCLHLISVRAGDCILVPAGTVHALGPGILLAEVQQQSNITWRLHDWGRVDTEGRPRPLHLEESLACIDFERGPVHPVRPVLLSDGTHTFEELVRCEYFVIRRHSGVNRYAFRHSGQFRIVMCLSGYGRLQWQHGEHALLPGRTILIPAESSPVDVIPSGPLILLDVTAPSIT